MAVVVVRREEGRDCIPIVLDAIRHKWEIPGYEWCTLVLYEGISRDDFRLAEKLANHVKVDRLEMYEIGDRKFWVSYVVKKFKCTKCEDTGYTLHYRVGGVPGLERRACDQCNSDDEMFQVQKYKKAKEEGDPEAFRYLSDSYGAGDGERHG